MPRYVETRVVGDVDEEEAVQAACQGALIPGDMMPGLFNLGPFEPLSIHIKCTPAQDKPVPDCLCQGVTSLLLSPSHPVQQAATSLSTFVHCHKLNFSFRNFGFNILLHLRLSQHHLLCFRTNTEKSTTGKSALSDCLSWSGSGGWCS